MVGEALCFLLQASEISWKAARGLMADANFISGLQQMDVEQIPLKNIQSIKGELNQFCLVLSVFGCNYPYFMLATITSVWHEFWHRRGV